MTTVSQTIVSAAQQIQTGNAADLKQGLQKIANLSKQQLTANQTSISYPLQLLTEAVDRNLKVNQQQITPQLGLKKLLKQTSDVLPDKLKRQMMPAIRTMQKNTAQAERIGQQQKTKSLNEQQQTRREIQKVMNKTDKDLMKLQKPVRLSQQVAISSVQQQIQPYRQIIQGNMPQVTQPSQLPSVMKLLTNYAVIQGLTPVGSVSNKGGSSYVGIKETQDQTLGIKTFSPFFMEKQAQKKSIPSISMQLQYYANKTMNSWNRYVDSQSQFVSFIGKVNTPTNRQIYMQKQFRTLNIMTFAAQAIATLSNYYIYMPLLKMSNLLNSDQSLSPSYQTFLNRYQTGSTIQLNPLLLTKNNAVVIVNKMFTLKSKTPPEFLTQIIKQIQRFETPLNKKAVDKFQQYSFNKLSQARQFLTNNGVQKQLAQSVLASKDWSSIKRKKVLMSRGGSNPFIAQLARKIVKNQGQQFLSVKTIDFSWSNQQIIAYDYIWGWSNKYN